MKLDPRIQDLIKGHGLILYDGECGFCQFWVQFILKRDPKAYFVFAPLQAPWTQALHGKTPISEFDTVILYEENQLFLKSSAVLRIISKLKFPWNLLKIFFVFPICIENFIYDEIAKRRKLLSVYLKCPILNNEERKRFLNY